METGFPHFLSLDNRFQAMTSLCLHGIILSRKAELDQFVCGLGPLVDVIRQHPKKMEPLFLAGGKNPVTAEEFLSLIVYEDVNDSLKQQFIRYVHLSGTVSSYHNRDKQYSTISHPGFSLGIVYNQ